MKNGRAASIVLPLFVAAILLTLWHLAVVLSGTKIFPSPIAVAKGLRQLPHLGSYIRDSLFRVGGGYLGAVLLGVPIGLALGWWSACSPGGSERRCRRCAHSAA